MVWITYDTPVDADDRADVEYVLARSRDIVAAADPSSVVLISSQLPVGSTRMLETSTAPGRTFACVPENLRLGDAIAAFTQPERIVVGVRPNGSRERIEELSAPFGQDRVMGIESAEVVKHWVNAFLALVVFATSLQALRRSCGRRHRSRAGVEIRGSDRRTLVRQARCCAFAGGTLARDIEYLTQIGEARACVDDASAGGAGEQ